MISFQILQMDPDAAKWLGFAKQQCKRIMDNGTKDFYREWPLGDATVKAKSYGGTVKLWLVAGGVADYVGVMMPNPVPYRGVSIGIPTSTTIKCGMLQAGFTDTVVMTSSMDVLADSPTTDNIVCGTSFDYKYFPNFSVGYSSISWNGGNSLLMFEYSGAWAGGTFTFDHELALNIPEDCIYPIPSSTPSPISTLPTTGYGITDAQWQAYWAAGVASFNTRRKAWTLKNSNEFMAALKGKFQPGTAGVTRAELLTGSIPASWDYQIKSQYGKNYTTFQLADPSYAGRHTKMPIILTVTYVDTVLSDTSAGLTQAGTMVTQRAATFTYVAADGVNQTAAVNGVLTQVVVQYMPNYDLTTQATYLNWYSASVPAGTEALLKHQFLKDRSTTSDAALWNGVVQTGYNSTSALGTPGNPLAYAGYTPVYPVASNTLASTAAPLYLQYHNTVLPVYVKDTAQSSTVMNNSALYHVKQIKLKLFGPAPGGHAIGIFADPTDADGATQIAYYGDATLSFDWTTGAITLSKWSPKQDANGNDAPTIISLPTGYSYKNQSGTLYFNDGKTSYTAAYNCAIGYVWGGSVWPDVTEYLKAKNGQLKAGTFDQVLYTIMQGKQITIPP